MLKTLAIFLGFATYLHASSTDLEIDLQNKSGHLVIITGIDESYSILSNVDIGEESEIEPEDSMHCGVSILLNRYFKDKLDHKGLNKITFEVIDEASQAKKEFSIFWDKDSAKVSPLPGYIIREDKETNDGRSTFHFVLLSEPK
ncbi:MAG: hypothetical protein ACK4V2_03735 [Pseudomonadota bacterium]|jgi:hypothetical protein|nr:hypothetical protein [Alphaproteobacteria bacterium]